MIAARALGPLAALPVLLIAGAALGQESGPAAGHWVLRAGAADVLFASRGSFTLGGAPVPGGDLKLSNNFTGAVEADYYLRPDWSLSLTIGVPPTTTARGRGSISALGTLGKVRYGPGVVLAKYHWPTAAGLDPWIGAGVTRMVVFGETDGSLSNLKVKPAWGGAVQAGAEYPLGPRLGVYASLSHLFLETKGGATFTGEPVTAKIRMNPNVIQAGLAWHY